MEQSTYYLAVAHWTTNLRRVQAFVAALCRAERLDSSHYVVLLHLLVWNKAEPPIIMEIAEQMHLRHHSILGLLKTLEQRGYVRREKTTTVVYLYLTDSGRALAEHITNASRSTLAFAMPAMHQSTHEVMDAIGLLSHDNGNGNGNGNDQRRHHS